ncbi:MAG: phenylalanine--tRNA ligase subunit beta [Candidatus Omnitrophica bacterium]|nr:phenylalanine--tRNA ligase subunit beta [Candidatus Omnitrophota bacterium]
MKLSLNWLKDYIDTKLSTEELVERLTMAGLEVEALETVDGDTVLEIEVTPNRPDCLNILGLAREIGAITGRRVSNPKIKNFKTGVLKSFIHIEDKKDCSRYIATTIRDVNITDAPLEMKKRLASLGLNAINNAVDITNFVLMETGQPLHAFDFDKLAGGKINIRRAADGESIVTLDGIERKLDPSILVIADAQKPVAIAGIMGGRDTQITAGTKNILLESAHFDMGLIRRACRTLGLRSDSSYRFERNVNFEGVLTGANRAADLLEKLTGGYVCGRSEISGRAPNIAAKVKIKVSEIESLLGVQITPLQVKGWLSRLGFRVSLKAGNLTVTAPDNRADIAQEADVIEEIARMIGFDRLPSSLPMIRTINIAADKRPREIKDKIRRILTAGGLDETITLSMLNSKSLVKSNMADLPTVRIFNPLSQDQELMRPSLLPSLLQVVLMNINRGQKDLRLFEIGKRYFIDTEKETLGILMTGRRTHDWRSPKKEGIEFFDLKGVMEGIFKNIGTYAVYEKIQMPAFDTACAAAIIVGGKQMGILGKIERKVLNNWDIKNHDVYFAELYLEEIISLPVKPLKYQPISEFPAIVRDVSLAVKKEIPYKKIEEACLRQGGDILRSVQFIEQYLGDKIQSGYKGIVFSCQYQSSAKTLREDEVSAVHEHIVQALISELAAIRR